MNIFKVQTNSQPISASAVGERQISAPRVSKMKLPWNEYIY